MARPRAAQPEVRLGTMGGLIHAQTERLEGQREGSRIHMAAWPKTRDEAARLVNQQIISVRKNGDGEIEKFATWDGESFDSEWFCTNECAMMQGRASAEHGARFTWKKKP